MPFPSLLRRNDNTSHDDGDDASSQTMTHHRSIKVVMLGESGVGKSSLFCRYVHNSFQPFVEPTIGAAFCTRTVALNTTDHVHLNIWDTAGQERYEALTTMYFRNAGAAILVFDMTRIHSYQAMQRWMRQVKEAQSQQLQQQSSGGDFTTTTSTVSSDAASKLIVVVVGNKSDLDEHRSVSEDEAREYAASQGAVYMETSAKEDDCVVELFEEIARRALQTVEPDAAAPDEAGGAVNLGQADASRRSCC